MPNSQGWIRPSYPVPFNVVRSTTSQGSNVTEQILAPYLVRYCLPLLQPYNKLHHHIHQNLTPSSRHPPFVLIPSKSLFQVSNATSLANLQVPINATLPAKPCDRQHCSKNHLGRSSGPLDYDIVANNMTGPESSGLPEGENLSGGVCGRRRGSCVGPDLELEFKR